MDYFIYHICPNKPLAVYKKNQVEFCMSHDLLAHGADTVYANTCVQVLTSGSSAKSTESA